MRNTHRFGLNFALRLLSGGLDPAGGGEGGDSKIGIEGAGAEAERVGTGDDRALAEAIERFHAIVKSQAIQSGNAKQFAIANACLLVGGKNCRRGGRFGLQGNGAVFTGVVALALVGIVADKENALAGFELGMRVLHQNGAGNSGAVGHIAMDRPVFEDDSSQAVAL